MAINSRHLLATVFAGGAAACFSPDVSTISEPAEPPGVVSTGGLLVRTVTRGHDIDADGYVINVQVGLTSSIYKVAVGVNDAVLIKHADSSTPADSRNRRPACC